MPLNHSTKVFAVKDAKVRKILTDPTSGVTTKGAAIDVPGIRKVMVMGAVNTSELRGDNTRLDYASVLTGVSVEFDYSKLSFDILGVVLGPTVTDLGVTPAQSTVLGLSASNSNFAYFEFEAQSAAADPVAGDYHILLYKCVLSSFPEGLGIDQENYSLYKMKAEALPRLSDGKWIDAVLNETAVALV